jgi:hypothetical protein
MIRYFTVYKTTNLVNLRFYLGQHKTSVPNDKYLGSGTVLRLAVLKYGKSSFSKEVLFIFDTKEEADLKETELIAKEKGNPLCYNLIPGGSVGWERVNKSEAVQRDWEKNRESRREAIRVAVKAKWSDPTHRESHSKANASMEAKKRQSQGHKRQWSTVTAYDRETIGRTRSERWKAMPEDQKTEMRKKCVKAGLGNKHHLGKKWITNNQGENRLLGPQKISEYLELGWILGRTTPWVMSSEVAHNDGLYCSSTDS